MSRTDPTISITPDGRLRAAVAEPVERPQRKPITHRWPDPPADAKPARMTNGMPMPDPVTVRIHRAIMLKGDMVLPGDRVENVPYPEAQALASHERGRRAEIIKE